MSVSFTFFNRFKDEGLHEGRQKRKSKTEGLVTYRDMAFGEQEGPAGAHKLLSCRLIHSLSQLLKNKKRAVQTHTAGKICG